MSFFNNKLKKLQYNQDPLYIDRTFAKIICLLIKQGKKRTAERIIYDVLYGLKVIIVKKNILEITPKEFLHKAILRTAPIVTLESIKISGRIIQVPKPLSLEKQQILGIKWIIASARKRSNKTISEALLCELIDIIKNKGNTIKKRDEFHKLAEKNRIFIKVTV
jgi:small subunit ribosomal protein S7